MRGNTSRFGAVGGCVEQEQHEVLLVVAQLDVEVRLMALDEVALEEQRLLRRTTTIVSTSAASRFKYPAATKNRSSPPGRKYCRTRVRRLCALPT